MTFVSAEALLHALLGIVVMPSAKTISCNAGNAPLPILVTVEGTVSLVMPVQPANALLLIVVRPSGRMIFVKDVQLLKA